MIETRLIEIWSRILGVPEISREDDFFALGGDSLSTALMLTEVQSVLKTGGGVVNRVDFFDQPTVAFLARILAEGGLHLEEQPLGDPPASRILCLQPRGTGIPFFCFAPTDLDPYYLRHLAGSLGDEHPFYAVCPPNPVRGERLMKVEDLALLSIAAIRNVQQHGPYIIGGHCFGGVLAFEAARQLLRDGEAILQVVLLDVPTPGYPKVGRKYKRYLAEARRILAGLARGEQPVGPGEVLRHLERLRHILILKLPRRVRLTLKLGGGIKERDYGELRNIMLWEYVPKSLGTPIVHFLAADESVSAKILDDPRLGWREFAGGGIEVFQVRGSHNTFLTAAHAPALAAQLEPLLAKTASSA